MGLDTRHWFAILTLCMAVLASACSASQTTADGHELWALMSFPNVPTEEYPSISAMAEAADVVVLGEVESISVGREWGDPREPDGANVAASLILTIASTEVVRGSLPSERKAVTFEHTIAGYSADDLRKIIAPNGLRDTEGRIAALPEGPALWFLRVKGDLGSEQVVPNDYNPIGGVSYRLVTPQGLIVDKGGQAYTPLAAATIHLDDEGRPTEAETVEERLAFEVAEATFAEAVALAR
ncbi:MAG: hypothetical protein KJ698_12395 [Actinobacteria bacterium]|nr:hypothetical protein [Actinomycetota bacterium]